MLKLIIFDYDGVIVDSFSNVHEVYKIICKKLGKNCPDSFEEFKKVYGLSSSECYNHLGFSEEEKLKGDIIFKEEILKKEPKLFEGIVEVLKNLHRTYKLVLISSSYKEEVEQKLKKLGLLDYFYDIFAKEIHGGRFEKINAIKDALRKLKVKESEALLVGDRNIDFIEGTAAGLKNILLVDYGWGYDLSKIPDYNKKAIIKQPKDILKAVKIFYSEKK